MTPPKSIDSPSLKGPTALPSLMKVTVVAIEVVEVQVRLEDEDPRVNTRGLVMLGIAAAESITGHKCHSQRRNEGCIIADHY